MAEWRKFFKNDGKGWKCQLCEKYLSVFPIYSFSSEQEFICGRCIRNQDCMKSYTVEIGERQRLYENVAHFLVFPCCYDVFGCKAELEMNKVMTHEDSCPFQNTVCPLNEMNRPFLTLEEVCDWRGNNKDLIPHAKTYHQKYFRKICEVTLPDNQTSFFFIEEWNCLFMVLFKYLKNENKYIVLVYTTLSEVECQFFRYQIEVRTNSDFSVVFRKDRVEPYNDRTFKEIIARNDIILDVSYLKDFLNTDCFNLKLSINKKSNRRVTSIPLESRISVPRKKDSLDAKLPLKIECMVCLDYMVPPIYLCRAGHSVCDSCTKFITSCPKCRGEMTRSRNYQLEDLIENINYPCRNKTIGCSTVLLLRDLKKHQIYCEYTKKKCILRCSWQGDNIKMINHLQQNHELQNMDDIITLTLAPQRKKLSKAVVYNNHIFQFVILYGSPLPLIFSLHTLSYHSKYKYEIHLLDKSDKNLDMIVNNLCPMLVINKEMKYPKYNSDEVKLPFHTIQHLITEKSEIFLKLTIVEVDS